MKIKEINLLNFGSYEGSHSISFTNEDDNKRVVVIGGKNGAGKTTLFTALQICLYGHYSFGFKSAGRHYLKEIYNLINNKVRLDDNASAFVEVCFEQVTDTEKVLFRVRRNWTWLDGNISETLNVWQDECPLEDENLSNFQNYLIHLIPPDLLKLYFFDGEKVADYFLGNHEVNIRDALMVLSGNDTFDILYDNVKRVLKLTEGQQGDSAKEYLTAKQIADDTAARLNQLSEEINELNAQLDDNANTAAQLTKAYTAKGGVTIDEWTAMHAALKEEEEKRERLNWQKKSLATDVLPFIIVEDLIKQILPQIKDEKAHIAYRSMQSLLDTPSFADMITMSMQSVGSTSPAEAGRIVMDNIVSYFHDSHWDNFVPIFGLSDDEETQVLATLSRVSNVEKNVFSRYQKRITSSINRSKEIRAKIQSSDIEHFEEYIRDITRLEEERKTLAIRIEHAKTSMEQLTADLTVYEARMKNAKKAFEEQLKNQSISALSGRVLLLLEDLQKELYSKLIHDVEKDINIKFEQLIRKKNFFSAIKIDDSFNIHILRNQPILKTDLLSLLKTSSFITIQKALGTYALQELIAMFGISTPSELRNSISQSSEDTFMLPVEIDKERLSSGEKQIFVMSLYWAMMRQSKNDLPYVIDTPFARIDTEHRANITDYFFKQLNGQLIVLSTDEEISGEHMASMREQIAKVYMLEYGQDKSTHVYDNKYFEV